MIVCFFGTYDKLYTSNKLILQGLKENNVQVVEINSQIQVTSMTKSSDMSPVKVIKRLAQKFGIFGQIFKNLELFSKADFIYVGFPGHIDVFPAFIIAKIFGKKLVFNPILIISKVFTEEVSTVGKHSVMAKIIKFVETCSYRLCDIVFADTPYQKKLLVKEFGVKKNKIRVLPLGADNTGYEYSSYRNSKKRINVVYYGLYSPIHGVEYIIEAANILKNDRNIMFSLVGSGPDYEINYKRAKSLRLRNVRFYPDVREGNHLKYLQKADVFLGFLQKHSSVERVVGNKVYQGMALGRTVLTADAAVTRSMFLHKENIYLCKPADPEALAKALVELKRRPALRARIARNSYALYIREYMPKVVSGRLTAIMKPVVRRYLPWRARFTTSVSSIIVSVNEHIGYLFELH